MNPLTLKLEHFAAMSAEDHGVLDTLASNWTRRFQAREHVVREGDAPRHVYLLLSGWACRLKRLENGRQQIVGLFLPGDLCDLNVFVLRAMDHTVVTLTPVTLGEVPAEVLDDMTARHPRIARALWWETLVSASIQREWIVSLGRRAAPERLAHLLCELFLRLGMVGMTADGGCDMPLTQVDLAEATGLSTVHVNRTLQELRAAGLIVLKGGRLTIPDLAALKRVALFNPAYLHLDARDGQAGTATDAGRQRGGALA